MLIRSISFLFLFLSLSSLNLYSQIQLNNNGTLQSITIKDKNTSIFEAYTSNSSITKPDKIKWKNRGQYSIFIANKGKRGKRKSTNYTVYYLGFFDDGEQFDNSFNRNEPLKFNIKDNYLLKSFSEAVKEFGNGGIGLIKIDPKYGYGSNQAGNIPANSTLYYLVQITGIN